MSILRPGAVTLDQVASVVDSADELDWMRPQSEAEIGTPRSPGLKYKHYAPKASVTIFEGPRESVVERINAEIKRRKKDGFSIGVLATDESICYYKEVGIVVQSLGSLNNSLQQASNLFHCLRRFDDLGIDVVFAEALPRSGAGDAVMNRLYRAAGGAVVLCGADSPGTPRDASEQ